VRVPPLNEQTAVRYLQERRILGDYSTAPVRSVYVSRRNHNIGIQIDGIGAWFIKQIQYASPDVVESLRREAACYQSAWQNADLVSLRELMPRCLDFNETHSILVLEFLYGRNALECHNRTSPFDTRIAGMLGGLLGKFHGLSPDLVRSATQGPAPLPLPENLPWVLRPVAGSGVGSVRDRLLWSFLSDGTVSRVVDSLRTTWRPNVLIHGDCRLGNFVFCIPESEMAPLTIRLVDWELADIGDASWDCANVMQHYWTQWAAASSLTPEHWDALAAALRAFWSGYAEAYGIRVCDRSDSLCRATLFTGIRLVQTTYEHLASSGMSGAAAARLLHLARQLLIEPEQALAGIAEG